MKKLKKYSPSSIGLVQALGVVIYCSLIGLLFWKGNGLFGQTPQFAGTVLMLLLLVFSAAITGALIFGYPVYLALKGKLARGIKIFFFTVLYCLLIIAIILTALIFR